MSYRGIIIEESLIDKGILDDCTILSTKESESLKWHMHKVEIPDGKIHMFTKNLGSKLDPNSAWYTHFYHSDPKKDYLIIVFYNKVFLRGKDGDLSDVIDYGISEGISSEQLDFIPRDVSEETW